MHLKIKLARFILVALIFMGLLLFFLARLISLQFTRSSFLSKLAAKQHTYYLELEPRRGRILDRNNRPLAVNVASFSLYAVPPQIEDSEMVISKIKDDLNKSPEFLRQRLNRQKRFVWLERKLPWAVMEKIKLYGLKGLSFIKESRRSYPNARLACQLIGFAGLDNTGLDGLELVFDSSLKGTCGWTTVFRDARQKDLVFGDVLQPPVDGHALVLTIDQVVQYIVERELDRIMDKHHAKGAMAVVMDVRTGEILAMANRPAYDLNHPGDYPADSRRNRAITDYFEPGSVFKIVAASAALDSGKCSLGEKFFCENGAYRIANHTLKDVHPYGWLTFEEVISQSSNIGTSKIAQKIGGEDLCRYARLFGFGQPTGVGLSGEVGGVLKPYSSWSKLSIGAVPIGQEVCVTALQLCAAVSVIANGGVYMQPYGILEIVDHRGEVIKTFSPKPLRRVISSETAAAMRNILSLVVEKGTGRMAQSKIYRLAGKTGTAQKVDPSGTYSHTSFIASFIGFAPADDPRIAIVVVADEPRPYYYGGVVSAPAFKNIAEDVLQYLDLNFRNFDKVALKFSDEN